MSGVVKQEILFFAASILTGSGLLWFYDVFVILRKLIHHKNWVISLEDFLYWCAAALIIFIMIFQRNDGIIRVHAFAGILIGVWMQWRIQSVFQKIWIKLLKKRRKKGKMTKTDDKGN